MLRSNVIMMLIDVRPLAPSLGFLCVQRLVCRKPSGVNANFQQGIWRNVTL
jgi:hypothetical protein